MKHREPLLAQEPILHLGFVRAKFTRRGHRRSHAHWWDNQTRPSSSAIVSLCDSLFSKAVLLLVTVGATSTTICVQTHRLRFHPLFLFLGPEMNSGHAVWKGPNASRRQRNLPLPRFFYETIHVKNPRVAAARVENSRPDEKGNGGCSRRSIWLGFPRRDA